jgi:hypothetical protein
MGSCNNLVRRRDISMYPGFTSEATSGVGTGSVDVKIYLLTFYRTLYARFLHASNHDTLFMEVGIKVPHFLIVGQTQLVATPQLGWT